jgi:hypothetical protein
MARCDVEAVLGDQARSKRSRFITLVQAASKSWTNFWPVGKIRRLVRAVSTEKPA